MGFQFELIERLLRNIWKIKSSITLTVIYKRRRSTLNEAERYSFLRLSVTVFLCSRP